MTPFPDTPPLLSSAEHARMLRDIAQVALAVAARASAERAWDDLDVGASNSATPPCPRERLGFLQHALPALAQACASIARAPVVDLCTETRTVAPPARARRVSSQALLRAVRAGHAAERVDETVSVASHNTPEARAVRAFLARLRRDADAIASLADAALLPDVAAEAQRSAARFRTLCALPLWDGVADTPAAWTLPPIERMTRSPAYARVSLLIRQYKSAFSFDWEQSLFALPARDTWRVYETWGLFQCLRALLALGAVPSAGALAAPHALLAVRHSLLTLRLEQGDASRLVLTLPGGAPITVFYQRTFAAGARSLSRSLQPDICIETTDGDLFLLDPKYKPYAAVGDESGDMDQMHAYRDAIVGPDGTRPVQRAWCVYAGAPDGASRPLIAYGPAASSVVGALLLRPRDDRGFARLCELLVAWLG